jgi:hypothetical protein
LIFGHTIPPVNRLRISYANKSRSGSRCS